MPFKASWCTCTKYLLPTVHAFQLNNRLGQIIRLVPWQNLSPTKPCYEAAGY